MVDEEKTKEEEPAADDSGEGDKSETTEIIERQNKRIKELEAEKEQRAVDDAKKQLGGRAEAGATTPKPKEETPKEYAEKVMSGALNKEQ